jgi:cyanophycinase-like exopeptidase
MSEGLPRLLVIMGSGETSPTMSKTHRELFDRLGPERPDQSGRRGPERPAVVLDTPVGFQENADDVSTRAIAYFRESVGREVGIASYRSAAEIGSLEYETMLNRLRQASYVFAGPGSPSYALAQWRESHVPEVLAEKLRTGGCLTFASAAAVTLGPLALPVYEIYKVGHPPHWLEGLDLMAEAGLAAVVVPHFDNAEGGTHDTRYCYMGERRLSAVEATMPAGLFILGVDEHTACVLDLAAGTATVSGRGGVTVRRKGHSESVPAGETVPIAGLTAMAATPSAGRPATVVTAPVDERPDLGPSPLIAEVQRLQQDFEHGLEAGDARVAAKAVLGLDDALVQWSYDTLQSDEGDRARAALRSMIVGMAEAAEARPADPRTVLAPVVEAMLELRERARADGRWQDADAIRDALAAGGVELRDTPTGTTWEL